MHSVYDELELTIECPGCHIPINQRTATIKRARAIKCPSCGRIDITGQRIQQLVAAIRDTERNFPDLGRNLRFKLD